MASSDFKKFKDFWEAETSKIENQVISPSGAEYILTRFEAERVQLELLTKKSEHPNIWLELDHLESGLVRALEVAKARYTLKNRSLWAKIVQGIADAFRGR